MRVQQAVKELIALAESLGLCVRYERGFFRGGTCRLGDQTYVVLNRRHPPEVHAALLVEAVRTFPLDSVYIRPALRAFIEQHEGLVEDAVEGHAGET